MAWAALWDWASKRRTLAVPGLVRRFQRPKSPSARLACLAGLGIAGGEGGRKVLETVLGSRKHDPELRVFALLAAGRGAAGVSPSLLAGMARDRRGTEVERAAAWIALAARGAKLPGPEALEGLPSRAFLASLAAVLDLPGSGGAAAELPPSGPWSGLSLLECETRILSFGETSPPGGQAFLERLLSGNAPSGLKASAAFALGRILDKPSPRELQRFRPWWPQILSGARDLAPGILPRLLEGPGRTRPEAWRRLWWAAAARHAPRTVWPELRRRFPEGALGRDGRMVLLRRALVEFGEANPGRVRGLVEEILGSLPRGGPAAFALESWSSGLAGSEARTAGLRLWRVLHRVFGDPGPVEGPGGPRAFLVGRLNELCRVFFCGGSRYYRKLGIEVFTGGEAYLPEGIREVRDEYFQILDEWLRRWPLFR